MEQINLFGLVDAENFTLFIHYMDKHGIRHTTQVGTSKSNYLENVKKWRQEHPDFYFLYCETFNDGKQQFYF